MAVVLKADKTEFSNIIKNLFLTKKQTDHVWHLILIRVEKAQVILDNTASKATSQYSSKTTLGPSVRTWGPDC